MDSIKNYVVENKFYRSSISFLIKMYHKIINNPLSIKYIFLKKAMRNKVFTICVVDTISINSSGTVSEGRVA